MPRDAWPETSIATVMIPVDSLIAASPDDDLAGAFTKLAERDVEQLLVVPNGVLAGMLERRDLLRWIELQLAPARGPRACTHIDSTSRVNLGPYWSTFALR